MEACFDHPIISQLREAQQLAPDSLGMPAQEVPAGIRAAAGEDLRVWLPGGSHFGGLKIEHDHRVTTGPYVGGVWGICWHITVSRWNAVDAMRDTLHAKHAEVQFVIGGRDGTDQTIVIQCLPTDQFGKGLVHLAGHAETNRKRLIQVEICATPDDMKSFHHYHALANLFYALTHGDHPRAAITNRLARSFANRTRFSESGFAQVKGHFGHMHVPENDHIDPTPGFRGAGLVRMIKTANQKGVFTL